MQCFRALDKNKYKLIKFDAVEFYPSKNEKLLKEALNFAKSYKRITENEEK